MENKEYLETTFPDGTPVKIVPGERSVTMDTIAKLEKQDWPEMRRLLPNYKPNDIVFYSGKEGYAFIDNLLNEMVKPFMIHGK